MSTSMNNQKNKLKLNVGGKIFETTVTTLANAGRNSMLGAMLDDNWNIDSRYSEEYFIDRDPTCFSILLNLLRSGELHISSDITEKQIYTEAKYYGLLDHVRSAKFGQFNADKLEPAGSVECRAKDQNANAIRANYEKKASAIRASPDGGCCVANGRKVHVYDWMLQEHSPINLDYMRVVDMGWSSSENIVISAQREGKYNDQTKGDGGIGLFNSKTGELKHKFQVSHEYQVGTFTPQALAFDLDNSMFCTCKGNTDEYNGVGVWDMVTGKQIDFWYNNFRSNFSSPNKLQWLPQRNSLLLATCSEYSSHYCNITLFDDRARDMVLCWPRSVDSDMYIVDTVAIEENNCICVLNKKSDVGLGFSFIDIRKNSFGLLDQWYLALSGEGGWSSSKLAWHGGKLFCSSYRKGISVFSGPEWGLVSELPNQHEDGLCDFSIGGDMLFALRYLKYAFDVWATPPSPAI